MGTNPTSSEAAARSWHVNRDHVHDALKLAVSLVLFYWFALSVNWPLPQYGALAIVLISLGTTSASLRKGLLRIVGTTVGVAVGFLLLALFAQDRLMTMLFLASYLVLIGYFMLASEYVYAWFVAGFVPLIVWGDTYMNVQNAFYFGTYRYLETTAGVVIYTLVCLVWTPATDSQDLPQDEPKQPADHGNVGWDSERFLKALFPGACFVAAFFFWIYVNPPTGPSIPMMAGVLGLVMLMSKANPVSLLMVLLASAIFAVAPVYLFVMPHLSHGSALFALIFVYSFVFSLAGAVSPALKMGPLVIFVMMTGISNQQNYSFLGLINGAMMILLAQSVVTVIYIICKPGASPIQPPAVAVQAQSP
jgi:uncharacterized membrane protein YccC